MKYTILALALRAGSASAQQVTGATKAPNALVEQAFRVAAADPSDEGYQVCDDVSWVLMDCINSLGGSSQMDEIEEAEMRACACCDQGTSVWPSYSTCANYISSAMPSFTAAAADWSEIARVCSVSGSCSSASVTLTASATGTRTTARFGDADDDDDSSSVTRTAAESSTITAEPSESDCSLMYNMFETCLQKTPHFGGIGYKSQAECYCCVPGRGQTSGTLTWTDKIDQHASACWDWAEYSARDTQWDYASEFATYCEKYHTVCDEITLEAADQTNTATDTTSSNSGPETVTVTRGGSQNTETGDPDAAAGLRSGVASVAVALLATLMTL